AEQRVRDPKTEIVRAADDRSRKSDADCRLRGIGPIDQQNTRTRMRLYGQRKALGPGLPVGKRLLDSGLDRGRIELARDIEMRSLRTELALMEAAHILDRIVGKLSIGRQHPSIRVIGAVIRLCERDLRGRLRLRPGDGEASLEVGANAREFAFRE